MSTTKMRVEIPENPKELLELAFKILKKDLEMGDKSPLRFIEKNNWITEGPNVQPCLDKHNDAEQLKDEMEKAYKDRDLLIEGITKAVKASRDVLTGVHHDNMKNMTDWGFVIIESVKSNPKDDK